MKNTLLKHKQIWNDKPILKKVYNIWYKKIVDDLVSGKTVEIGAGTGNFKEFRSDVVTSDIDRYEWLDMSFDAHVMPFKDNEISNLVLIDALHHLADPIKFFDEAKRVLRPGGRIVMVEPYPSWFSLKVYRRFHEEPFIFDINYFRFKALSDKDPWESNQAIPFLLFFKHLDQFNKYFNNKLIIKKRDLLSFVLYPATGGFDRSQFIPTWSVPVFRVIEWFLKPLAKYLAFRCYIVIEKK
ncbi:MAG: class I SAM-dependent methyltransferase [Patescibacteria group bacterium]|nr:class I SAM-dependent methyltransferase [Patescibacteria group bacterium]